MLGFWNLQPPAISGSYCRGAGQRERIHFNPEVTCGGLTEAMRQVFTENPEVYIGQVFKAKGNTWYPSGSIRHPKFLHWRDDKDVEDCTYDQIPKSVRERAIQ